MLFGRFLKTCFCLLLAFAAICSEAKDDAGLKPKVWIFETELTGAMNQRLGVARRLSDDIEVHSLPHRNKLIDAEATLRQILGSRYDQTAAWPDFILHTEDWKAGTLGLDASPDDSCGPGWKVARQPVPL